MYFISRSDHAILCFPKPLGEKWKRRFYFDQRWIEEGEVKQILERIWGREIEGSRQFRMCWKLGNVSLHY